MLQVLSSETAQEILSALDPDPRAASEIPDSVGQSVQNVSYHLDRLCEAELVTQAGTRYSEKGREMTVYALAPDQLSAAVEAASDRSYLVSNSWMSWPIFAYQSLSIRCMSSAICEGSVGE